MTRLRTAATWVLLAGVLACETTVTAPPEMRRPMEPLPFYPDAFVETEACSGLDGEYALIDWYTADVILEKDGKRLRGQWVWPHDIILRNGLQQDTFVVKHEILHDLLRGDGDHARQEWQTCGLHPDAYTGPD